MKCGLCGKRIESGSLCKDCAGVCFTCGHRHGHFEKCETCGHQRRPA